MRTGKSLVGAGWYALALAMLQQGLPLIAGMPVRGLNGLEYGFKKRDALVHTDASTLRVGTNTIPNQVLEKPSVAVVLHQELDLTTGDQPQFSCEVWTLRGCPIKADRVKRSLIHEPAFGNDRITFT